MMLFLKESTFAIKSRFNFSILFCILFSLPNALNSQQPFPLIEAISPAQASLSSQQLAQFNLFESRADAAYLVSLGDLKTIQNNGILTIEIPGYNGELTAVAKSVKATSATDFIWYGEFVSPAGPFSSSQLVNNGDGNITIISQNGSTFGRIIIDEVNYALRDLGNGKNILLRTDPTPHSNYYCATPDSNTLDDLTGTNKVTGNEKTLCDNADINVLVFYTDASEDFGDPHNDAVLFINDINQACNNSDVSENNLSFHLAGVEKLEGFIETESDPSGDLSRFENDIVVQNLRDQYSADLAVLLVDNSHDGAVGIAYQLRNGPHENLFVAIVRIDFGSAGSYTFAHEVGHLLGAGHDTDPAPGIPHGHNYTTRKWFLGKKTWRRTILDVGSTSRILHYSNPDINFAGEPTGIPDERDNAQQLDIFACDVAEYREDTNMSVSIDGPGLLETGILSTWCADVNNCGNVSSYLWEWSNDGFTYYHANYSSCFSTSSFATTNDRVFLRLTATCSDGQSAQDFQTVFVNDDDIGLHSDDVPTDKVHSNTNEKTSLPEESQLDQLDNMTKIHSFPNPANIVTQIGIEIPKSGTITLEITDIAGNSLKQLFKGEAEKGQAVRQM